ncbi:MAG TPA: hypothetical protein VFY06_01095 [Verrucomicrobiae bacterium]|nr:hypothetical protein [Verrucomicrobiae bacterium]
MKSKLLLYLALVLGGCSYSQKAQAFWMTIPLNRTNLTVTAPFLRIVSTRDGLTNNPIVQFTVFVLFTNKSDGMLLSGSLEIRDGQGTKPCLVETMVQAEEPLEGVVATAVPKSWAGKYKIFRFDIAASLLADSTFTVGFGTGPKMAGTGDAYSFRLKDFAEEK